MLLLFALFDMHTFGLSDQHSQAVTSGSPPQAAT
jgi:hypothetical protein